MKMHSRARRLLGSLGMTGLAAIGTAGISAATVGRSVGAKRPAATRRVRSAIDSPLQAVDAVHGGHFVVASTKATFRLRGFDYQPLVLRAIVGRSREYANETFAPSYYNHSEVVAMLKTWQGLGYNAARVFLNPGQIGNPHGAGLNSAYVRNLADFVKTAAQYGVRTLITVGALPNSGGYAPSLSHSFGIYNADYLSPVFIASQNRYLTNLITALRGDGAPLVDALWELKGEQDWNNTAAPLSWKSGIVATADGKRYNMASAASRVAMENSNLVHWANSLTSTIHRLVPGSLVGVGVYPPSVKRSTWTVRPQLLFAAATQVNFVDIHVYPNLGPELTQVNSFGAGSTRKPVIMGEFGATRAAPVAVAVKALTSWQRASCHIGGLAVSGWLMWTWNSSVDTEFWDALDDGGLLSRALAPTTRPNPCQ